MFRKHLKKSVATAAAVGTVLAIASVSSPATVSSAPAIKKVACTDNYPNPIDTDTNLSLTRPLQQYGQPNQATARVSSNSGDPTGVIRFSVAGRSWTKPVVNGEASIKLPRRLQAGDTYIVRARFRPDCSTGEYAGSGDREPLTVYKAKTRVTDVFAPNRDRGERPRVRAVVSSRWLSPGGSARVTIFNDGAKKSQVVAVEKVGDGDSLIRARFSRTYKLGEWGVRVKYLGTRNFEGSQNSASFNITR